MKTATKNTEEFDFRTIESVEDALKRVDEPTLQEYLKSIDGFNTPDERAYKDKKLVAKALRGDWEPDYENRNQDKWEPFFYWSPGSGFVFTDSFFIFGSTITDSGSRLCFPNKEMSDYFGKQFIDLHRTYLTIQK
jgi:hypothetical protein